MQPPVRLKLAFASDDRLRVNQHFGSATAFVMYNLTPQGATVDGFGEFPEEAMDGNEDKLLAKVDFLTGCDAVFVRAIGASAIKQLLARGVQPIRVGESDQIEDLLRDIGIALNEGGVPWIERALATREKSAQPDRFAAMEEEGWDG
ncbi:protein NifX [Betaproteobacteria bacterium]|nr:protein NifX [Betaproteobacteria bacterium]GHU11761.1 protein NifX [Betaproteobacteria bacterium]GHU20436.1 protein NifX [Betaproteobacteria bacterium]